VFSSGKKEKCAIPPDACRWVVHSLFLGRWQYVDTECDALANSTENYGRRVCDIVPDEVSAHWNIGGSQVERRRRENRGAVGGEGSGVTGSREGLCPFPENL